MKGKRGHALRAAGHRLSPTLFVGKAGAVEAAGAEAKVQLKGGDVVKVKLSREAVDASSKKAIAEALAAAAGADLVEVRGFTVLLARRGPRKGP